MKFTCTQENLKNGLSLVSSVAKPSTTLPILSNVLIKAELGGVELIATNLELAVSTKIRAKIDVDGEYTINAKLLNDYISFLQKDNVNVELVDDQLIISCLKSSTKIKGLSAVDFPVIPNLVNAEKIQIKAGDFYKVASLVNFSVTIDETRPEISGVLMYSNGEDLIFVGTDSFRLSEARIKPISGSFGQRIIVPLKAINEISRVANDNKEELINISAGEGQITFECGDYTTVISRLIEGNYPDYQAIIPTHSTSEILVDAQALNQAIKSAALFCKAGINDVTFVFDADNQQINISSANSAVGESVASVEAQITGPTQTVVFNYRYIADGMSAVPSKKALIKIIDANAPSVITSETPAGFIYIVMPIRK
jgi:DNA polymerase III subunit beta